MTDKDHPIWEFARSAIWLIPICLFLYVNATNFDKTEIKSIIEILIVGATGQGVVRVMSSKIGKTG